MREFRYAEELVVLNEETSIFFLDGKMRLDFEEVRSGPSSIPQMNSEKNQSQPAILLSSVFPSPPVMKVEREDAKIHQEKTIKKMDEKKSFKTLSCP